ncbi:MAG: hypothetical protein J6A50_04850 [Clostridia bacterium]|nr:hypothetical protein [Clostridia bacterium]
MDKIYIKEILKISFGDRFEFHPKFYDEFSELISKSGQETKIVKAFIKKLYAIIELGDRDYGVKWLEHLKEYGNMYSLHIDTNNKNYRLLFSKKSKKKYFLHLFFEKSGKGATSYEKHVPVAIERRDNE